MTQPAREPRILLSLLHDLQAAKERIEQQANALQQSNDQLKAVSQLKDEFVAKVSHELRTPLTSVKEGLSLILDGALGETTAEQRDFLKTMNADIDRLTELINNVLDIAKIEAGRMHLVRGRLDLKNLIESLIRSYQPIIGHRKIETIWGDAPPVFADSHRIRQVLVNLFSNALKFTSDRGTITFRGERRNGMVAVVVEDDGPGIAPEDLPKLFQKFSQIRQGGIQQPRGTGLGLTVCKELTELHRGTIEVASVPGRGTTFTVYLPMYTEVLALQEGLRELFLMASGEHRAMGLLAIEVQSQPLEAAVEQIRGQLHRDDVVVAKPPSWVVVLAVADVEGLRAIAQRLRQALPGGSEAMTGVALVTTENADAEALFQQAIAATGVALLRGETMPPSPAQRAKT